MKSIDINQMQFKELAKTISKSSGRKGLHLEDNDLKFLISKTNEFLAGLKRIVITDRKHVSNDGYFVLDKSTGEGIIIFPQLLHIYQTAIRWKYDQ